MEGEQLGARGESLRAGHAGLGDDSRILWYIIVKPRDSVETMREEFGVESMESRDCSLCSLGGNGKSKSHGRGRVEAELVALGKDGNSSWKVPSEESPPESERLEGSRPSFGLSTLGDPSGVEKDMVPVSSDADMLEKPAAFRTLCPLP